MVRVIYVSIVVVALLAPARAAEGAGTATQLQLDECAGKSFEAADKALNATYKEVMDRLGGDQDGRKLLVAAQKDWLAFRDGECEFEASSSIGGSIHPMVVAQCQTTLTQVRTHRLRQLLDCKEGDVACPLPPR